MILKKGLKWAVITAAGIALFLWGKDAALAERGYNAVGGEYLLLLFPLFWLAIETTIKDFKKAWRDAAKPEEKGDDDGEGDGNGGVYADRNNSPARSGDG